jgi:hypothetical protein
MVGAMDFGSPFSFFALSDQNKRGISEDFFKFLYKKNLLFIKWLLKEDKTCFILL